jgi:hypothetical protein
VASILQVAVLAASLPVLDVRQACHTVQEISIPEHRERAFESCVQAERRAKALITENWAKFSDEQRRQCTQTVKIGPSHNDLSYVDIWTCLQVYSNIDIDAEKLKKPADEALPPISRAKPTLPQRLSPPTAQGAAQSPAPQVNERLAPQN